MTDKLKEFVNRNKKEFDTEEPSKDLWNKIGARMEGKNSAWISSKLLPKLKYFGLSATILVVAVYFIMQEPDHSSSNELAQNNKDSAMNSSGEWVKAKVKDEMEQPQEMNTVEEEKGSEIIQVTGEDRSGTDKMLVKNDSVISKTNDVITEHNKVVAGATPKEESPDITIPEKKEMTTSLKRSETVTEEKLNTYRCTLLEGASFCSVVKGFKFPGQVSVDGKIETMACSKLEDISDLKAVVVKGRTSKEMELSFSEGFKNIVIQKSDGTKLTPVAISHYYKGLGVISAYKGKRFDMMFKDKVEMILFFKNVEAGDKISIDKTIEAVVGKP